MTCISKDCKNKVEYTDNEGGYYCKECVKLLFPIIPLGKLNK